MQGGEAKLRYFSSQIDDCLIKGKYEERDIPRPLF